jgi:hypothetical protein
MGYIRKYEAQNPKSSPCGMPPLAALLRRIAQGRCSKLFNFGHLIFGFVSSFDIRVSSFD